jgi:hypothetical protein
MIKERGSVFFSVDLRIPSLSSPIWAIADESKRRISG